MNLACKLCSIVIQPYQLGTLLVESDDTEASGLWHEDCYKQYREDYRTADDVIHSNDVEG